MKIGLLSYESPFEVTVDHTNGYYIDRYKDYWTVDEFIEKYNPEDSVINTIFVKEEGMERVKLHLKLFGIL